MKKQKGVPELQRHKVTLSHAEIGDLGEGKLSFGGRHWAGIISKNGLSSVLSEGERLDLVTALTDS